MSRGSQQLRTSPPQLSSSSEIARRDARIVARQGMRAHGRPGLRSSFPRTSFHGGGLGGNSRWRPAISSINPCLASAWFFGDDVHESHLLDLENVASQPVPVVLTGPHRHRPPVHKQSDNRHRLMGTRWERAESGQPTHLPKVPLTSECRNTLGDGIDVAHEPSRLKARGRFLETRATCPKISLRKRLADAVGGRSCCSRAIS